eukprot:2308193-Prymnesium_polylepis.1
MCQSCPQECQDRYRMGQVEMRNACFSHMVDNGQCDDGCNNLQCGYDECTTSQITSRCIAELDFGTHANIDYRTPPRTGRGDNLDELMLATSSDDPQDPRVVDLLDLVPVKLSLDLSPARLQLHPDFDEIYLFQAF